MGGSNCPFTNGPNMGGGGGGNGAAGAAGGSGIVIVKNDAVNQYFDMDLRSTANSITGAAPTKGDIVLLYTDAAGTATLNTGGDLIASISRDNGTTWTAATLVAQGTQGSQKIATVNELDISGQPDPGSGNANMKWRVETDNQAAGKQTRLNAISLGWS